MYLTAVDLGSSQIKALVTVLDKENRLTLAEVFKLPSRGMRKGEIADFNEALKAVSALFIEIRKISKGALKNIFINVGGKNIRLQGSRGIVAVSRADNEIYQEDVDRVIKASQAINLSDNRMILHTIVSEFIVNGMDQIQNPIGMVGNRLEVNSFIADAFSPIVNDVNSCVDSAGGSVGGLVFNPLASSRAVLNKVHRELGVAMIDIGFGTTSLAVFEEDKLIQAKVFPVGAGNITNDLAIQLKSSIDVAEKIKISFGHADASEVSSKDKVDLSELDPDLKSEISRRYISEIIEARLAEIFEMVNNELKSIGKTKLPAGVILCGGGSKIPGIIDLARHELKLPAHFGVLDQSNFSAASVDLISRIEDPEFSLAAGLVLWGYDQIAKEETKKGKVAKLLKYFLP
ncbi:MAG: cell division protein FtsA [Candidatus Wolfebacteria bacterium]|nr:cell division protein FtsA [Candidatus Wolfebacteria bacterium]